MSSVRRAAALVLASALAATVAYEATGPGPVEAIVVLRQSRFVPAHMTVPEGTTVRFVVRNEDVIDHELIIGDQRVQDAHEVGSERRHGHRPGEVSVAAGGLARTVYRFDEPGLLFVGCHLPGHWAYGMRGTIRVVSRRAATTATGGRW